MTEPIRHEVPADLEGAMIELGLNIWRVNDDEVTAWCPMHVKRLGKQDRHPSWSVNRNTGLHNCYSCGYKGSFVKLVMDVAYPHDLFRALRFIHGFGHVLHVDLPSWDDKQETVEVGLLPEVELQANFDPPPDWALDARMLTAEACAHYGIRWDPRHESWIIPFRTPDGELLGWQEKWQKRKRFINFPKDMKKSLTLFGYDVFPRNEPIVLMEAPLDVGRLHSADFLGGLGVAGDHISITQLRLMRLLSDRGKPELIVALDNDKAGQRMAAEIAYGKWEDGKQVWGPWSSWFHVRYLSYAHTDAKDIGAMSDSDVRRALYESTPHPEAVGLEPPKEHRGVHRKAAPVSGRRRGAHDRSRAGARRLPNGKRQDGDDDRLRRGAGRRVR